MAGADAAELLLQLHLLWRFGTRGRLRWRGVEGNLQLPFEQIHFPLTELQRVGLLLIPHADDLVFPLFQLLKTSESSAISTQLQY